jgi:hypothetical protein
MARACHNFISLTSPSVLLSIQVPETHHPTSPLTSEYFRTTTTTTEDCRRSNTKQ